MTRRALLGAALAAGLAATGTVQAGSSRPALRLLDRAPVVLAGSGFAPRERVKVSVVTADATLARSTVASRLGRFRIRFAVAVDPCTGARRAEAAGSRGSRAALVLARPSRGGCAQPGNAP